MNALKTKAALSLALFAGLAGFAAMPATAEANDNSGVEAYNRPAPLTVRNSTASSLRLYVDNNYQLRIPAFKSRTVYVRTGSRLLRVLTRDGRSIARRKFISSNGLRWTIRTKYSVTR